MQRHIVRSLEELAALVEGPFADGGWMFRGQGRPHAGDDGADYLVPKIGRQQARRRDDGAEEGVVGYAPEDEAAIFARFRAQAIPFLQYRPKTLIDWLAVAQHHGLPTRLIDWTESLLVAAYFAVRDMGASLGRDEAAVIYAERKPTELPEAHYDRPFDVDRIYVYRPPYLTSRIPAQQAVLTVHPEPTRPYRFSAETRRIAIPKAACGHLKHVLSLCSINQEALFPGLDGLAETLAWRYKWHRLE